MQSFRSRNINRRQFTIGSAAAFAAVPILPGLSLAAQDASPAAAGENQLEIFSWWTAGSEASGLEELFNAFTAVAPDVEIVNAAVAGGAGSNAQAALQTRLQGGDPPDSWQSHPGEELLARYVEPGFCEPITYLWDEEGWNDAIPEGLAEQSTVDGEKYLIPVGVHRGNVMFFNRQVLTDNGVEVGDTMSLDDFFAAADTLQAAGITPLALGTLDGFEAPHLFECILAAHLGSDGYNGLWTGETPWDGEEVTGAIEIFARALDYVNEDHPALTWDGAMDHVFEGNAAFTIMGDWAWGNVVIREVEADFGYVAAPGSEESFIAVVDGFTLPVNAPHPINAETWLRTVGSAEAQIAFAPFKGCIPARTDVDTSELNEYGQWSANDFSERVVVPSNAHGAAASPQFRSAIFDAIVSFLVDKDVAMLQEAIVFGAEDAGLGM
jgi:glucose/mannose transport system substrate-binding protein